MEDEDEILHLIWEHCQDLYSKDHCMDDHILLRDDVLRLIVKKLIDKDN